MLPGLSKLLSTSLAQYQCTSLMASTCLSTGTSGVAEHVRVDAAVASSSEASDVADHISLGDSSSEAPWTPVCDVYRCTLPGTHPDPFAPRFFLCSEHFQQTTSAAVITTAPHQVAAVITTAPQSSQQRRSHHGQQRRRQSVRLSGVAEQIPVVAPPPGLCHRRPERQRFLQPAFSYYDYRCQQRVF